MGSETSFSLLDQPWIPARATSGSLGEMGLRQLLLTAHELRAVEHPLPIVECGLIRLAIALVLDIFRPRNIDALVELVERGGFDHAALSAYFNRWEARFDLFSARHPFFQDPSAAGGDKPLAALAPYWPSGTNVVHWQHGSEDQFAVTPGEAAQLLTTVPPFMTAGGAGLSPSVNGAPPVYVVPQGETLFQTLVLNLWAQLPGVLELGEPHWRRPASTAPTGRRTSATLLEAMTWMPRRILLRPGAGGRSTLSDRESPLLVQTMCFSAGWGVDFEWTDPQVAYIYSKNGRVPLRLREEREPWRDAGALALLHEQPDVGVGKRVARQRPPIVSQWLALREEAPGVLADELKLRLYAIRTDLKMKVFEHVGDSLALPAAVVLDADLALRLARAVRQAEDVQETLRRALARAVRVSEQFEPTAARDALVTSATRAFWVSLDQAFVSHARALAAAPDGAPRVAAIDGWQSQLRARAVAAFDDSTARLRSDAARLVAVEQGRSMLSSELRRILPPALPSNPT